MQIKQSIRQYPYEWLSAFVLLVYFFPAIFMMDQAMYLIHDNLNSNVVWYKRLAESGLMFGEGNAIVEFTMGGIPRDCLPSEWNIERLLYYFFSAQWAYTLNYILIHCIAYLGMRILIKKYITQSSIIYNIVALTFACLPHWPSGGLTVAGLPLLLYAFLNIFNNQHTIPNWLIIIFFPFYSFLPIGNLFSFPLIFIFYLWGLYYKKWVFSWIHLLSFCVLLIVNILVEYRFIGLMLSGFQSNRIADITSSDTFMNIKGILGSSILAFFFGQYHFHSLHLLISLFVIIYLIVVLTRYKAFTSTYKYSLYLLILLGVLAFLTLLINNFYLKSVFSFNFPKVNLRFWVVFPLLWYVIFALILDNIKQNNKTIVSIMLFVQFLFVFLLIYPRDYFGSRYSENIFTNTFIYSGNIEQSNWNEYYQVNDFQKIKKRLPESKYYYIATIGITPEILQYNGYKTIEGYYAFYPLNKYLFIRKVDSLERSAKENDGKIKVYTNKNILFEGGGNKNSKLPNWDFNLLEKSGVKYVFSRFKFENKKDLHNTNGIYVYETSLLK